LTQENCPRHTSFISFEKLQKQFDEGRQLFVYVNNSIIVGCFALSEQDDGSFELSNVAVQREYRGKGYGKEMVAFAMNKVKESGRNKIIIGIIEENVKLKDWYSTLGFKHKGTRRYNHLPFTVGNMEVTLKNKV
jgi:diamine N-acetyltransferase